MRLTIAPLLAFVVIASLGTVTACDDDTDTRDSARNTVASSTSTTAGPTSNSDITLYCMKISPVQARSALGVNKPFGVSKDPKWPRPCGGTWTSEVAWEAGEGGDGLAGTLSDANVTVDFADFPDAATATAEFQRLRSYAQSQMGTVSTWPFTLESVDTTGDAEALMLAMNKAALSSIGTGAIGSSIYGRCHARIMIISVGEATFYLGDKFTPNSIERARNPVDVRKDLVRSYQLFGAPLCAGATPPAIKIGRYQPLGAPATPPS